jgi:hypothetical protein
MDLIDRHTLIGEVQDLIVHMRIEITLSAQDFLDTVFAPPRPVV